MASRIAALAGLCTLGVLQGASTGTYTGTLKRFHFTIETRCSSIETTTKDYDASETSFGPFQFSCNGYNIEMSDIRIVYDRTITATVNSYGGSSNWYISPPLKTQAEFTVKFTSAPNATPPAEGSYADTNAVTSANCPFLDDELLSFFSSTKTVTRTIPTCGETDIVGTESQARLGMSFGAYFLPRGTPDLNVSFDAYYDMVPVQTSLTIDHIDVVQVIQDASNSIELVADKSAEVRVYIKASGSESPTVEASLSSPGRSATDPMSLSKILKPGEPFDFLIDGPWVSAGAANLQVDAHDSTGSVTASKTIQVVFKQKAWPQPFIVIPIAICEKLAGDVACPERKAIDDAAYFMQKVFPVADDSVLYLSPAPIGVDTEKMGPLVKKVQTLYYLLLLAGIPPSQLVAWVPFGGLLGWHGPNSFGGRVYGIIRDQNDLETNAFELASQVAASLGVRVNSQCLAPESFADLDGYDPAGQRFERNGLPTLDVCREFQADGSVWISKTHYQALLNAFKASTTGSATPAGSLQKANAQVSTQYLMITGDVALNGLTADLDPGFLMASAAAADPSDPNGNYCLRFSGPSGILGDYCFPVSGDVDPAPFAVLAPLPFGANRVGLVIHGGSNDGKELASITASATPPGVKITSPSTGASLTGGTLNMSWNGVANSPLAYNLLYSSDGGATWTPIDTGLSESSYILDTRQITGGSSVMFRVQASDGLNNAADTVGPLTITQTPHLVPPSGAVDFHKVLIGTGLDQFISLANTGNGPLRVTAAFTDTSSFKVMGPAAPFAVGAAGSRSLTVRFTPTANGAVTGKLTIASDDPSQPNATVMLHAEGITTAAPSVNLGAGIIDFGNVVAGQSTDATFPVENFGPGVLTISNIQSSNATYSAIAPSLPFTVAAGRSQDVKIHFAPTSAGVQNSVLTLTTNDPDLNAARVNTTGNGVTASSGVPAVLPIVVNAASGIGGGVAPGEIVLVFGSNVGPTALAGLQLDSEGKVATSTGSTQVFFDGVAAPMVYASAGQTAAIVPYAVSGRTTTQMQVVFNGLKSNVAALPVVASLPGIFTANSSGKGQGAILLPDYSVNSAANPAPAGSTVLLYTTGEGQTRPRGRDGVVTGTLLPVPNLPVEVTIGGVPAVVQYAGEAPSLVSGVMQVNVVIPDGLATGDQPVVLKVGSASSRDGVTVAVRGSQPPNLPKLTLSTPSLAFGNVNVSQAKDLPVTVSNTGDAALSVSSVTINGNGFSLNASPSSFMLPPNGNQSLTVRYAPTSAGAANGTLAITSNDSSSPAIVSLSGTGVLIDAPRINVNPQSLNFGVIAAGQRQDLAITISNAGTAALNVNSVSIANAAFQVVSPQAPFNVAAGASQVLTLRFSPAATGAASGTLTLTNNDPANPLFNVQVRGTGSPVASTIVSDTFNRSNASLCALGQADLALGGSGAHYYLPIFAGASIATGALQQNGLDFGGVQLTASSGTCSGGRGETLPQDLTIKADLLAPKTGNAVTGAGVYFRSRPAAAGDGIVGGSVADPSAGYWIELLSTGMLRVYNLNPFATIASSAIPASFDSTLFHTMQIAAQGSSLQVLLDGQFVTFNGSSTLTLTPTNTSGNKGTAGIAFSAFDNRGQAGGQRAENLVITQFSPF